MRSLAIFALLTAALRAQLPPGVPPDLRFEVASLRPSHADPQTSWIRPATGGERYEAVNSPIRQMLEVAFRIRPDQITGIPGWLEHKGFDMQAKAEKPSSADELHVMLINLLADRMHLTYRVEKKEMAMYALVQSQEGAKLKQRESSTGDTWIDVQGHNLRMTLKSTNARMDFLAFRLGDYFADRPVVDMTELKGTYDFEMNFTRDLPRNFPEGGKINGEDPDTSGPNLFAALKQQLGLELKAQKGPVDVIVVDHAEPLSDN